MNYLIESRDTNGVWSWENGTPVGHLSACIIQDPSKGDLLEIASALDCDPEDVRFTAVSTLSGHLAIAVAAELGLTLSKYTDPTEPARSGLSVDEAREIAREDASLIHSPA